MLNVVRSAVITSTRRTNYFAISPPACLGRISSRQTSNDAKGEAFTQSTVNQSEPEKQRKSKIDRSKVPLVSEDDLDERFISGWGPGGQKVNKAVNCCQLRHKPTGIVVKVHQSRSLAQNRKIARELLAQRLDKLYNGEQSVESQSKRLALQQMSMRETQSEKRRAMKEQHKKMLEQSETSD